ncbi:glycosyltransferase family 4 protein [Sporomusa sp.]|uniref:glycosyltransferase family 4 protein n=1 Tax=Sporomusa sp. TaxID=2078658 RepID=UPI002C3F1ABA|nr:glycosyltransferase family 4 protein [Sporomusa sp.]HWR45833.1 glycosyltransferase family 4 protein [Sporomusa sp.]
MKVLLLSRYTTFGASSRYRSYQYIPFLNECGIKVTTAPLFDDQYLQQFYSGKGKSAFKILNAYLKRIVYLFHAKKYDLLWIEKELFPWLPEWVESFMRYRKIRYVVDYDDAIFHNYDINNKAIVRATLGHKIDRVMKNASVVIAGNQYLMDRAIAAGAKRVEYLPTVVDLDKYSSKSISNNELFVIGWIGSPSTTKYIRCVQEPLTKFCADGLSKLVLVGAGKIDLPNIPVEIRSWSEASEIQELLSFDVGIMPLFDSPWERGKCGFKLIQYMGCGKPVIGCPVGVNQRIIRNGLNGFHATTSEQWQAALQRLRNDKHVRDKMGQEGRAVVEKEYCVQVTAPRLAEILYSVVQ